jgi:hypothetical protein
VSTETDEFPESEDIDPAGHPVALLGLYALGTLDPDELEVVTRHVQSCASCRTELAGYDEIIGLLPYSSPQQQVPIRARAGLLARLDEIGTSNQQQMIVLPAIPREKPQRLPWLRIPASPKMMAFAAVPLVLILAIVGIMANVINDQQEQIATIESEQAAEKDAVDKVLLGTDGSEQPAQATFISSISASGARAKLIVNHETNSALILARDLPVTDDASYVAWLRLSTPNEYARAGVLVVAPDGRASLSIEPHDAIQNYTEVIVTLETDVEATAPTGPQIMTAAVVPESE